MKSYGIEYGAEEVASYWSESVESFPGRLSFLEHDFIKRQMMLGRIDPALLPLLQKVAGEVESSHDLQLLAWHMHQKLVEYPTAEINFKKWPDLGKIFGKLKMKCP